MSRIRCTLLAAGLLWSTPIFAQNDTGTPDPGATASTGQPKDYAALKAQYEAQTAAFNAAKAAADAKKAAIEAEQQAGRASLGTVTGQTTITGTSELATGAGNAEAMLLTARASQAAAGDAVTGLTPALRQWVRGGELIVLTSINDLALTDVNQFDLQRARLETLLNAALGMSSRALALEPKTATVDQSSERMAFATAAGAALDIASKIGSYFQTDYKFGALTPTNPDNLDAGAIGGALLQHPDLARVVIPSNFVVADAAPVVTALATLDRNYIELVGRGAEVKSKAAAVRTKDPDVAAALDAADAVTGRAVAAYEAFLSGLVTASGTEPPPLARVIRQNILKAHLVAKPMVLLLTSARAAAYYTKKNLWTFLGGPPLYTMGGISMVYTLLDPASGQVVAAGVVAKHGGYRSVSSVQLLFR